MNKKDSRIYGLDIIRIICTAAVFIYHLNRDILKGGYLAVCVFLVLYGYLLAVSAMRKDKFSLAGYYAKRIIRLYLPLLVVTCIAVLGLRYATQVVWLNEKPETMSVIEAWNNWWQISAGSSYFARVTESPFTHMWYIAMLIQIELVMPLLCKVISAVRKKISFWVWWIPFLLLTLAACCIMPYLGMNGASDMRLYYGTDSRLFSVLAGMCLGFLHTREKDDRKPVLGRKGINELLFMASVAGLIWMFFNIDEGSQYYRYGFIASSILSLITADLCAREGMSTRKTLKNPVSGPVSSISYEVYLLHYPAIFYAGRLTEMTEKDIWIMAALVIAAASMLHFGVSLRFKKSAKVWLVNALRILIVVPFIFLSVYGAQDIHATRDHTQEMAELELELEESTKLLEEIQKEYMQRRQEEQDILNDPEAMARISDARYLPVTCIGDSVMLGAISSLRDTFPNGDFDAQENRSHYPLYSIVRARSSDGTLGDPVIIGIGTNNVLPESTCEEIIQMCGDREIYWLTITNDWQFPNNDMIKRLGEKYENVTVVDWAAYSEGHDDFFYYDGIHLTPSGRKAYAEYILECISRNYVERKLAEEKGARIIAIGDGYLLSCADLLTEEYDELYLIASEELIVERTVENIEELKMNDAFSENVFIVLGPGEIGEEDLMLLMDSLEGCKVTVFLASYSDGSPSHSIIRQLKDRFADMEIEEWTAEYIEHPELYTPDREHLSNEGKEAFSRYIIKCLNERGYDNSLASSG